VGYADVAQLVEHQLPKLRVAGSNPVVRFKAKAPKAAFYVSLAIGLAAEIGPSW
jgi:hypothetical protein